MWHKYGPLFPVSLPILLRSHGYLWSWFWNFLLFQTFFLPEIRQGNVHKLYRSLKWKFYPKMSFHVFRTAFLKFFFFFLWNQISKRDFHNSLAKKIAMMQRNWAKYKLRSFYPVNVPKSRKMILSFYISGKCLLWSLTVR